MPTTLASLEDVFAKELQDILSAEQQIMEALPRMAQRATSEELREAFERHLQQTDRQIDRIRKTFDSIQRSSTPVYCEGIMGILREGEEVINADAAPEVVDAALIAAAQKVEHYEIATYGSLCAWAEQLGFSEAHDLLGQTLEEEKNADWELTQLATKQANVEAEQGRVRPEWEPG